MKITLGTGNSPTELCAGQERNNTGSPVGPENLSFSEAFGVIERAYVGADRQVPEHIKADLGTCSFSVTRTFASVAAALAYISTGIFAEATSGALKFDSTTVFEKAALKSRVVSQVGCTVKIAYSIEG